MSDQLIFVNKLPLVIKGARKFILHIYHIINIDAVDDEEMGDHVRIFIEEDGTIGFVSFFDCVFDESYKGLRLKAQQFIEQEGI